MDLFWDVYHIIMDGSSTNLSFSQFVSAYHGVILTPEQLTQFHLSNYEQKYIQSELFVEARKFFDQKLTGRICRSEPAFDLREYADGVRKRSDVSHTFSDQTKIEKIEHFTETHDITVATFFAGALAYALREMTKNEQVFFLSVESWPYDCYPFELLESKYGVSNSITYIYQGETTNGFQLSEHFIPMEFISPKSIHGNLLVHVFKRGKAYELAVAYNSEPYEKKTIDKLMNTYVQMIDHFLQ